MLHMLNLSVFYFYDVFVASFIYVLIIAVSFIVLLVNKSQSSRPHTHMYLHSINSIPELRPFRRKCWLRSNEIVIFAIAKHF